MNAAPGPALLDVVTDRFELVMPPKVEAGQVAGMALYSAKAAGRNCIVLAESTTESTVEPAED